MAMANVAAELANLDDAAVRSAAMENTAHSDVVGDAGAIECQEGRCGASHEPRVEEEWAVGF